jgi:hydrogenase expression/formation protein HypD
MMRVPGAKGTPLEYKARGADVRIVYSPSDALTIARKNPDKHVMFFAIGFETTAPSTALTVMRARSEGIRNFSVFCNHVTIIPAMRAILDSPDMRIDAFIGPGHVSTVIGCRPYEWIAKDERKPVVCSGFEPLDILQSIVMLLHQLREGRSIVENQYKRVVPWEGNRAALKAMAEVFQLRPYFEWRGLGFISQSALRLRDSYAEWDAERRFSIPGIRVTDPKAAQCGEVLKGVLKPDQCKLFGRECTPEHPIGALMVSSEGSCAAHHNYALLKSQASTLTQVIGLEQAWWGGPPGPLGTPRPASRSGGSKIHAAV